MSRRPCSLVPARIETVEGVRNARAIAMDGAETDLLGQLGYALLAVDSDLAILRTGYQSLLRRARPGVGTGG